MPRPSPIARTQDRDPAPLHRLIQRANRARERQARRILSRCLELIPHYRGLPGPTLESTYQNIFYHVSLFYRVTLPLGRALSAEELEPARRNARLRASQGVPLGEFLSVYQIGSTIIWDDTMALAGGNVLARARLLDRMPRIIANQTQLTTAVTEAYVEERESLSRFREQALDDFFQSLVSGDTNDAVLEARAKALGIPLEDRRTAVLFRPATAAVPEGAGAAPENVRPLLSARIRTAGAVVGRLREGFVVLVPADSDPEGLATVARSVFGDAGRVGIGNPGEGLAGLRRSAREASRALEIGSFVRGEDPLHRYADLAILDLVRVGSEEALAFVQSVLGPLVLPGARRSSLETLRQLARCGFRMKQAAAALSIHPNTLAYRLRKMRDRFAIDVEDAETRLRVQLALLILDSSHAAPTT